MGIFRENVKLENRFKFRESATLVMCKKFSLMMNFPAFFTGSKSRRQNQLIAYLLTQAKFPTVRKGKLPMMEQSKSSGSEQKSPSACGLRSLTSPISQEPLNPPKKTRQISATPIIPQRKKSVTLATPNFTSPMEKLLRICADEQLQLELTSIRPQCSLGIPSKKNKA